MRFPAVSTKLRCWMCLLWSRVGDNWLVVSSYAAVVFSTVYTPITCTMAIVYVGKEHGLHCGSGYKSSEKEIKIGSSFLLSQWYLDDVWLHLFVCLFVQSIAQKRMIPNCLTWDGYLRCGMVFGIERSKIKVTGSISAFSHYCPQHNS